MKTDKHKKVGVIVFGAGMNTRTWIEEFKQKGYLVLIQAGYAELYKAEKEK